MNSLFQKFGKQQLQKPQPNPMQNVADTMNQFKQFASAFRGNPEQQVKMLLSSGKMSQDQYQQLQQMASTLQNLMGKPR